MILAEFITIDPYAEEAVFVCEGDGFLWARLPLSQLGEIENKRNLLAGLKIECNVVDQMIKEFRVVNFPIQGARKIRIENAIVVAMDDAKRVAHVLCLIPALEILSKIGIGEWRFADKDMPVLAEFHACGEHFTAAHLSLGEELSVEIEWIQYSLTAWRSSHWTVTSVLNRKATPTQDLEVIPLSSHQFVGLKILETILQTDSEMYLVVEVVDWNSPDARLKVTIPKTVPSCPERPGAEVDVVKGLKMKSLFSRRRGTEWFHDHSKVFEVEEEIKREITHHPRLSIQFQSEMGSKKPETHYTPTADLNHFKVYPDLHTYEESVADFCEKPSWNEAISTNKKDESPQRLPISYFNLKARVAEVQPLLKIHFFDNHKKKEASVEVTVFDEKVLPGRDTFVSAQVQEFEEVEFVANTDSKKTVAASWVKRNVCVGQKIIISLVFQESVYRLKSVNIQLSSSEEKSKEGKNPEVDTASNNGEGYPVPRATSTPILNTNSDPFESGIKDCGYNTGDFVEKGSSDKLGKDLIFESNSEIMIKLFHLDSNRSIHVINLDQKPYVCSGEISKICGWPGDMLHVFLSLRKNPFKKITIKSEDQLRLFELCIINYVEGVCSGDVVADSITLYSLEDFHRILELYVSEPEIIASAKKLSLEFNDCVTNMMGC